MRPLLWKACFRGEFGNPGPAHTYGFTQEHAQGRLERKLARRKRKRAPRPKTITHRSTP